jgi:hypothetical protein
MTTWLSLIHHRQWRNKTAKISANFTAVYKKKIWVQIGGCMVEKPKVAPPFTKKN